MCLLKPLGWNWLVCRSLPEQQLLVNGRMEREARWPLIFKPVRFVREICNLRVQSLVASDFQSHGDLQFVMFDFQTFTDIYVASMWFANGMSSLIFKPVCICHPWDLQFACNQAISNDIIHLHICSIFIYYDAKPKGDLWCSTTALFSTLSVLFMHFLRDTIPYQFCSLFLYCSKSRLPPLPTPPSFWPFRLQIFWRNL